MDRAQRGDPFFADPGPARPGNACRLGCQDGRCRGRSQAPGERSRNLAGKEDVWKFQLSLMAELGKKCDYVVMTNPHDSMRS